MEIWMGIWPSNRRVIDKDAEAQQRRGRVKKDGKEEDEKFPQHSSSRSPTGRALLSLAYDLLLHDVTKSEREAKQLSWRLESRRGEHGGSDSQLSCCYIELAWMLLVVLLMVLLQSKLFMLCLLHNNNNNNNDKRRQQILTMWTRFDIVGKGKI